MHPVLFEFQYWGETKMVTSYGVFAVVGIFAAAWLIITLGRKRGVEPFDAINIIALLVAGGILFSLFIHFIIFLPERLAYPSFFRYPLGVVSWGGVAGGFIAALWVSRAWRIPLLSLVDFSLPGVALGFAFGRVGCHFAGCCFGLHYNGPLSLHFTHPLAPASGVVQPLFPIQLLSALLLLLLSLVLLRLLYLRLRPGYVLLAYLVLYGAGRFTVEIFRNDPRGVFLKLSDAQWYSLLLLAAAVLLWRHLKRANSLSAEESPNAH